MPRPVRGGARQAARRSVSPEAQARLPDLLALPPDAGLAAQQFDALANATPGGALALIDALGGSRDEAAGRILGALALSASDKELRKEARRALHKLRSAGVAAPVPVHAEPPATPGHARETLRPIHALATPSDGVGSRLLWLLFERPHGGLTMFNLAINDVVGLKDSAIEETSRRRFEGHMREWTERTGYQPIEIPVEYGLALLSEALALNSESQFPLPRDFVIRRPLLGELPPPPTSALIHQYISRGQIFLLPTLLEESPRLLDEEPELRGWIFGYGEVERFAREYQQAGESRLLLTSEPPEARRSRILDGAIDALFTTEMRRAFRRRLEETAYMFWQTDRQRSARQAVAAAFAITDTGSLRSHPLLRHIVELSLELAAEANRTGEIPPDANRTARSQI